MRPRPLLANRNTYRLRPLAALLVLLLTPGYGAMTQQNDSPRTADKPHQDSPLTRTEKNHPPPLGRIRIVDGIFREAATGRRFCPYGFNFNRLRPHHENPKVLWHDNFNPARYDAAEVERLMTNLSTDGFNVVRVFLDHMDESRGGIASDKEASGLSPAYENKLLDFLDHARRHQIRVILCFCYTPDSTHYRNIVEHHPLPEPLRGKVGGANLQQFHPGRVAAHAAYMADLVRMIRDRDPSLLSTVFAYEITNEAFQIATAPPFSLHRGTLSFHGTTYDLGNDVSLQALADASMAVWVNACRQAVRAVDPEALVSISVFSFDAVGRTGPEHLLTDQTADPRFPARPLALVRDTTLDYVDIHLYARTLENHSVRPAIEDELTSLEFKKAKLLARRRGKPLIMGEFGAFRSTFGTVKSAVSGMVEQVELAASLGFQGMLFWTYDTREQDRILLYARTDKAQIYRALADLHRRLILPPQGPLRFQTTATDSAHEPEETIVPEGPNLLPNPRGRDVDRQGRPRAWHLTSYDPHGLGEAKLETVHAAADQGDVLRITSENKAQPRWISLLSGPFALLPHRRYLVEFEARVDVPRADARFFLLDATFAWVREHRIRLRQSWHPYKIVISIENANTDHPAVFRLDIPAGATVWLRRPSVRLVRETTPNP